jgi:hypothetical protein
MGRKLIKLLSLRKVRNRGGLTYHLPSSILNLLIGIYFSYAHHMGNWRRMSEKAPAWVKYWKSHLMEKLLYDFLQFMALFLTFCHIG